jgi:spermidine synthase
LISFALAPHAPSSAAGIEDAVPADRPADQWTIYVTIALSGACALGAEVIWTRLMGMMLGSTVYVFAIILAVFLIGLAIGSAGGSWLVRLVPPRLALGWSQVLLIAAIAWAAHMIADSLPYWRPLLETGPWKTAGHDLLRCIVAILPSALLWGASFPLALAAVASPAEDSGRVVGGIYAANTLGAIVGALAVSLWLVPWIGTQQSQRLLLILSAVSAWVALFGYVKRGRSKAVAALLAASLILAGALSWRLHKIPGEVIAYGRRISLSLGTSQVLYTVEGRNSSVAITLGSDGATEVDVNGHVEATTEPYDMKLQRMVGHLPALLHPNPKTVLGIGFGAGVSAGTFTRYPGIQSITVCEIEPAVPPTSTRYFAKEDYDVMHNPRTRIIFDDARHYLLTTRDKFDIIASDPLDVFVKGTAAIYSEEYFEQVKRHLNPGGMFTLYVPLYESDVRTVKSEVATFMEAFPNGTLWANTIDGEGYDMVFMGQAERLKIDLDEVQKRLDRPDYALVTQSLSEIGVSSAIDLLSTYAGQKSDFGPWLQGADINRDADLRLQYLGGWGINSHLETEIYRQMLSYRRRPTNLFAGSARNVQYLMNSLSTGAGGTPSE